MQSNKIFLCSIISEPLICLFVVWDKDCDTKLAYHQFESYWIHLSINSISWTKLNKYEFSSYVLLKYWNHILFFRALVIIDSYSKWIRQKFFQKIFKWKVLKWFFLTRKLPDYVSHKAPTIFLKIPIFMVSLILPKTYSTAIVPQVELFSFIFCENSRHQKDVSKLIDL